VRSGLRKHRAGAPFGSRGLQTRARRTAVVLTLAILAGWTMFTATTAQATDVVRFLRGPGGRFQPAVDDDVVAWEQNSESRPNRYNVYARADGSVVKANRRGTSGANGGIDGRVLVYQQFRRNRSDLKFFDVITNDRTQPPSGVNTSAWEYWPSISGDWLLFGRRSDGGARRILLVNLETERSRSLDRVRSNRYFVGPGQVNGDYAVWYRCSRYGRCNVLLHRISTGTTIKIPKPDASYQRAPSVAPDGTVYFTRAAGRSCAVRVKLMRYRDGNLERVSSVPLGKHIADTYVDVDVYGNARVFFDRFVCGTTTASDIFVADQPRMVQVDVSLSNPSAGSVSSEPAGIDCPPVCSHEYRAGTPLTLRATPNTSYESVGWTDGICAESASKEVCYLIADDPVSITALFIHGEGVEDDV
jgi:hypothetical protein